ncbi:RES family NAD+ phosphorylase [Paenibacillus sp. FSL R7-0297]|uniref:RES family NAD+ phosphorylase n=1 Tax=Paenibacillus sp. FSL R7-0297 TaxID=2921680 RepID=UPI0030F75AD7
MSYILCVDCIRDTNLKRLFTELGFKSVCDMCGRASSHTLSVENKRFQTFLKAVIRYHYSETKYNSHWGGYMHWVSLFSRENPIFCFVYNGKNDNDKFSYALESIDGHIDDFDSDVSLYFGGGRMDAFISSIKNDTCEVIMELESAILKINPYIVATRLATHLKKLKNLKIIDKTLTDKKYFRARIGVEYILADEFSTFTDNYDEIAIPYKNRSIAAPCPVIASEGRLNRQKTSYIYLASNIDTAIAEVKPNKKHYISIGEFEITKELDRLRIADFHTLDFYDFTESDNAIDEYVILKSIQERLSLPNPDKNYDFTQVIADALILLGFDGVKFSSSVNDGFNLVLFDTNQVSYVRNSHKAVVINEVKYQYHYLDTTLDTDKRIEYYIKGNNNIHLDDLIEEHFGIKEYSRLIISR